MGYGEWIKMPDGTVVHVYYGGKRPAHPPKCAFCEKQSTRLCDFAVSPPEQVTHKRTCDAPMCDAHAQRVGPNLDYCPKHQKQKELFKEANMKFLEGLAVGAFVDKAKLKADLGGKRWARIEIAVGIYQEKRQAVRRTALADEILAHVPPAILSAYNAMTKSDGTMRVDFSLCIRSQNVELRMSPDLKQPTMRAEDVELDSFRLEMADAKAHTIALYFSFVTALTDDVARFLVNNLGAHVWCSIGECQQELGVVREAKGVTA